MNNTFHRTSGSGMAKEQGGWINKFQERLGNRHLFFCLKIDGFAEQQRVRVVKKEGALHAEIGKGIV